MKKSQHKKAIKVKIWQNPKSGFVPKKQRPPELKTLATNQDHSLPPMLEELLPNSGKHLWKL